MKRIRTILSAIALSAAAAWVVPVFADPPAHAPAHGYRAKHGYVYYPEREIYYSPQSSVWFWLDGGNWRVGANLPVSYQPFTRGGISIELGSDRPYTEHGYVVEHYGKGHKQKRSKKNHKHKH